MTAHDFEVRKGLFANAEWEVRHVQTGRLVTYPVTITLHDGREMPFNRPARFKTRKAARQWMADDLPALLALEAA